MAAPSSEPRALSSARRATLRAELARTDLDGLCAVRMAREELGVGHFDAAVARLRSDAAKLRELSPALYDLVQLQFRPGRVLRQTAEDNFVSDEGYRMQREYGLTPNGNRIGGHWVLRDPNNAWIDVNQYSHDLLARHGFVTAQPENTLSCP